MLKHYVIITFLNPIRSKVIEVKERNENFLDLPEGVATYRFFDRNEIIAEDGELLIGRKKNFSETIYLVPYEVVKNAYREYFSSLGKPAKPEGPSKEFAKRMRCLMNR